VLPGKEVSEVEKGFDQELSVFRENQWGTGINKGKNQLEASFIFGQEFHLQPGMLLARHEIVTSWNAMTITFFHPKVTPEDINE